MPGIHDVGAFLNGAGGIIALLLAVGVFKDRWPVSWLLRRLVIEPASDALGDRISHNETVQAIHRELHPNGGTSMRDAVNRIEVFVDYQHDRNHAIANAVEAAKAKVDLLGRRVEEFVAADADAHADMARRLAAIEHRLDP